MFFRFEETRIQPSALRAQLTDHECGGYVSFEGWVRNHHEGRGVTGLEYEAYHELAEKEGLRILDETAGRFDVHDCACVHRVGKLDLGEIAVWVGVSAAHRDAAFEACRFIIDEVKHRVPIWKKEHFQDGDKGWVNCETVNNANSTNI
jgi:molybdopterin synthase catalytic subunit